jgi:hypothetical protein
MPILIIGWRIRVTFADGADKSHEPVRLLEREVAPELRTE